MNIAITVLTQVAIMFLLILVGVFCYKKEIINEEAGTQLSEILLMLVTPAVIINAFQIDYNPSLAKGFGMSLAFAALSHIVGIILSFVFIRKDDKNRQFSVERFGTVYGNASFMGIPLIAAVLPENGVFYASAFIAVFNIFLWTHGVTVITGKASLKELLKVLKSPPIIGIILGLFMFFFSIRLPSVIGSTVSFIADLNTPLAMIVTGIYIGKINIFSAFTDKKMYRVLVLKLIALPLVMIGIFMFINAAGENKTVMTANLLATACPTAATTLLVATKYRVGPEHASKIIAVTTVFSIITMPVIMYIFDRTAGLLIK